VIDIRKFFDLPEKGLTDLNKVIIVRDDAMEFGILADELLGTRTIPLSEVQPPLATLTGIREEYLKGVTRNRTAILDGARLLSDKNLIVNEEVT
jgi:purine-binding chemotaxis protein CheW